MKRELILLAPAALVAVALAATATAMQPSTATPTASASANDDTLPPALAAQTLPAERSPIPTADEWKTAKLVEPARRSPLAVPCRVYLLREYVKVHCPFLLSGLRQQTGSIKDVQLWVTPKKIDPEVGGDISAPPNGGQVVFPLVRGDARMFQFFEMEFEGYGWATPSPSVIVDAFWIDGRPAPNLILR